MFGIPGNPPVTLTPAAVGQIQKLMDKDGHWGLKLGVKKGGCAGMEYTLALRGWWPWRNRATVTA